MLTILIFCRTNCLKREQKVFCSKNSFPAKPNPAAHARRYISSSLDSQLQPQNKQVRRLTDEELQKSIDAQKSENTERTTKFALRTYKA